MSYAHRKFHFVRKAARAQWYIEPWLFGLLALSIPGLVFLMGVHRSAVAWLACAIVIGLLVWRFWQQHRYESAFWEEKRNILVWLEDGRLFASKEGGPLPDPASLSDISAVDALEEKGMVVRLLVDKKDGTRVIYAGFNDMEAFAREFRLNAPHAKFRRVRVGFTMKLKEV